MSEGADVSEKTLIKFCGLVDPGDVDAAVGLGVDAIGFVFYPRSPRYLEPAAAERLRARLPSTVRAVGLFVNERALNVRAVADLLALDVIQFHGDETPADCLAAAGDRAHWRAVRMRRKGDLLESIASFPCAEAFLLDAFSDGYGGSGHRFDWSLVDPVGDRRLIVSGGLTADTVGDAVRQLSPWGVDVSSGIQADGPRRKSPEKMAQFVDAVRAADSVRAADARRNGAAPRAPDNTSTGHSR